MLVLDETSIYKRIHQKAQLYFNDPELFYCQILESLKKSSGSQFNFSKYLG